MTTPPLVQLLKAKPSEGAQELLEREQTSVRQLRAEVGGVLRLPEGVTLDRGDVNYEAPEDETMILNLGPSHPSTHGVLRVMVEIKGEQVLRTKPVIGYLHTGMEKTGEELMYHQGGTNVTRMDYLSPFFNELAYCLCVEKLAGIEMPRARPMDPHADVRAQPHQLALPVAGHQRCRPGRAQHARLRLAGPGNGPGLFREGHGPADEPQLHPSRRRGRRIARRLAGRRPGHLRHRRKAHGRVRQLAHGPTYPAKPYGRRGRHRRRHRRRASA